MNRLKKPSELKENEALVIEKNELGEWEEKLIVDNSELDPPEEEELTPPELEEPPFIPECGAYLNIGESEKPDEEETEEIEDPKRERECGG